MKTYTLTHNLKLVDVAPPIRGHKEFIGVYVLKARRVALIDSLSASERRRELYFVKKSIMGFVDYFKRYGTEYIKQCNKEMEELL